MQEDMVKVSEAQVVSKEKKVVTINELIKDADSFFIGVTIKKGNELRHEIVTQNFPLVELLSSCAKIKGLVIEEMEKTSEETV